MNDLVIMKDGVPVVSTFYLFEKMGYKEHRKLKEVISTHKEAFEEYGFLPLEREKPTSKDGGRPSESYLLNEDQFILLVLLAKNSPESVDLKIRVSREFKRMKSAISNLLAQRQDQNWQNVRADGKAIYFQKTDVIKQFVEYATVQGSTSASKYYMQLAKMENNALFFIEAKYSNLREIMTIKQLMQVAAADDVVEKAIKDGMNSGMHYKEIYQLAKERVVAFAGIIGRSFVQDLQISHKK